MAQTIVLPSASAQTIIKPPGGTYQFQPNQDLTVCFGTASRPGSFSPIEGNTYQWQAGQTYGPYGIPPNVNDSLPYNTTAPNTPCSPSGVAAAIHVIVVGAGITIRKSVTKKAPAKKKSVAKKTAGKTRKSSTAKKAAPKKAKKAAKKAVKKSAGKSKAKSPAKGKKKSAKSRSRR